MKAKSFLTVLFAVLMVACNKQQSLQEFYVAKQDDADYKKVDLPPSLLINQDANIDAGQREALETIRKVNVLVFPVKKENRKRFTEDSTKLSEILQDEKYHLLAKYGSNAQRAELFYMDEEDAIDEIIVVGYDQSQGFAVARILGNDMDPDAIMDLYRSMDGSAINPEALKKVKNLFQDKE